MEELKSKVSGDLEEASNEVHVSLDVVNSSATTNHHQQNDASANTFKFWDKERYGVRLIPKVPAFVRDKYNSDDYDPLVVSLGPYHHGHPRLKFVEELKPQILKSFVNHTSFHEQLLLNEVLKVINDLRGSYAKGSTDMFEDIVFAQMMLQDAAFAVEHIVEHIMDQLDPSNQDFSGDISLDEHLGRGVMEHVTRDLYVLENQIPFWFLKIALHMRCGKREGDQLLKNFLNWSSFRSVQVDDNLPAPGHLVQEIRTVVIAGWSSFDHGWLPSSKTDYDRLRRREKAIILEKIRAHAQVIRSAVLFQSAGAENYIPQVPQVPQVEGSSSMTKIIHSFHSVTELKAKGIHIRRSVTNSLMDVSFRSGFFFSTLHLPTALATVRTRSVYSNIIAYEMSPQNYEKDYTVTAYVNFFKSLIESPKDVKELQDKGVIKNMLGSDEEVVKLYKDIYTFGIDCSTVYSQVIEKIQKHYNSRARTWLADLLHSYFHSPWTAIALLGSILVIGLTITQAYYAIHPKGDK